MTANQLRTNSPLVYVIMRNHNAYSLCDISLNSLYQINYPNFQILLVDDGSNDSSSLKLKRKYPQLKLIFTDKYLEYCKSLNFGIRYALEHQAQYVFIINNDTKDFSPIYLDEVIKAFKQNKKVGLVGTKCYDYENNLRWQGKTKYKFGIPMATPTEGFVLSSQVINQIGGFNNWLIRYFEDLDLIIRLRNVGYITKYISSVSFDHLGGGTSSKQIFIPNYYRVRNIILLIKGHMTDQPFSWKLNTFLQNYKLHQDRIIIAVKKDQYFKALKICLSVVAGIMAGLILPWKEDNAI